MLFLKINIYSKKTLVKIIINVSQIHAALILLTNLLCFKSAS